MRMNQRQFRIGELSRRLGIEAFVIRFWEKEFGLSCSRSQGGQRFYTKLDEARFSQIKSLLYEQGYTISGAKKYLQQKTAPTHHSPAIADSMGANRGLPNTIVQKLVQISGELRKIKELF